MTNKPLDFVLGLPRRQKEFLYANFDEFEQGDEDVDLGAAIERKLTEVFNPVAKNYGEAIHSVLQEYQFAQGVQEWLIDFAIRNEDSGWAEAWGDANPDVIKQWQETHQKEQPGSWYQNQEASIEGLALDVSAYLLSQDKDILFYDYEENRDDPIDKRNFVLEISRLIKTPIINQKYGNLGQDFLAKLDSFDENTIKMLDSQLGIASETNHPNIITDEDLSATEVDTEEQIPEPEVETEPEPEVYQMSELSLESFRNSLFNISEDNPDIKISQNGSTGQKEANILGIVTIPVQDYENTGTGEITLEPSVNTDLLFDTFKVFDYARNKEQTDENYQYSNAYLDIFDEFYKTSFETMEKLTRQGGKLGIEVRRDVRNGKTFDEILQERPHIQKAINNFQFYNEFSSDISGIYQQWRLGGKLTGASIDLIMNQANELIKDQAMEGKNLLESFSTKGVLDDVISGVMALEEDGKITKEQILGVLQDEFKNEFVDYFNNKREYGKLYAEQSEMLQFSGNVGGVNASIYCRTCGKFRRGSQKSSEDFTEISPQSDFWNYWSEGGVNGVYWDFQKNKEEVPITEFSEQEEMTLSQDVKEKLMTGCVYQDGIPQCDPVNNLHMPLCGASTPVAERRNFSTITLGGNEIIVPLGEEDEEILLGHPSYQNFLDKAYLDLINPEYNSAASDVAEVQRTLTDIIKISGRMSIAAWTSSSAESISKVPSPYENFEELSRLGEKLFYYFVDVRMKKEGLSEQESKKQADRDVNHFIVPDAGSNSMLNRIFRETGLELGEVLPKVETQMPFSFFTTSIADLPVDSEEFSVASDPQSQNRLSFANRTRSITEYIRQLLLRNASFGFNEEEIAEIAKIGLDGDNFDERFATGTIEQIFIEEMLGSRKIVLPKIMDENLKLLKKEKTIEDQIRFVKEWVQRNKEIEENTEDIRNLQWRSLPGFNLREEELAETISNLVFEMEQSLEADKIIGYKGKGFAFSKKLLQSHGMEYESLDTDTDKKVYAMFLKSSENIGMKEKIQQAEQIKNINLNNPDLDQERKDAAVDEYQAEVDTLILEAVNGVVPMMSKRAKNVTPESVYYHVRDAVKRTIERRPGPAEITRDFGTTDIADSFIREGGKTLKENLWYLNAFVDSALENSKIDADGVLEDVAVKRGNVFGVNPDEDKELTKIMTLVGIRRDIERLIVNRPDLVAEDEDGGKSLVLDLLMGRTIKDQGYHQFVPIKDEFTEKLQSLFNQNPDFQSFLSETFSNPTKEEDEIWNATQRRFSENANEGFIGNHPDPLMAKRMPQIPPTTSFQGKLPEGEPYDTVMPPVSHEESPKEHEKRLDELRRGAPAIVDAYVKFLSLPKSASDVVYDIVSAGNGTFLNKRTMQVISALSLGYLMNPAHASEVHIQDLDMLKSNMMMGGLTTRDKSVSGYTTTGYVDKLDEEGNKIDKKRVKSMRYYLGSKYRDSMWKGTRLPVDIGAEIGVKSEAEKSWYKTNKKASVKENWYKIAKKNKEGDFACVLVTSNIDGMNMADNAAANSRNAKFEKKVSPVFMLIPFSHFKGLEEIYKISAKSPFDFKIITNKEFDLYEKMGIVDRSQIQNA